MKKRIATIIGIIILLVLTLTGCGNYDMLDLEYTFDKAIVKFPDGTVKTIEIQQWTDYEGEQIQITDKDGNVYIFCSNNCVLIKEK